ncbi:MAG: hypothetical protein JWQ21_250 [Herminiimonas sp.]|nr:hypothetical protein [Herminiimonas sp.]
MTMQESRTAQAGGLPGNRQPVPSLLAQPVSIQRHSPVTADFDRRHLFSAIAP